MEAVDKSTVLDAPALLDDDRRYHATAAALATGEVQRPPHGSTARANVMLAFNTRRGLARRAQRHAPSARQMHQFDACVRWLPDHYLDGSSGAKSLRVMRPRKRISPAPAPHIQAAGCGR